VNVELAAADVGAGLEDREAHRIAGRPLPGGALDPTTELGAAGWPVQAEPSMQRRIILVCDQDFGDIPL
jgi:hypothetical protein